MQIPSALVNSLQHVKGFNEKKFKEVHQSGEQVTSVRLNPKKIFNFQSSIFNTQLEKVPWNSHGRYLPERPSFTLDPLFHAGAYYVQEASSMFLEEALKQAIDLSKPLKILDLCAAPGGKSTLIQSIISKESLLVSNELIKTRVNVLSENITKWGADNVIVSNNDPADFQRLENYFDLVVVDAPCSGSGLFRKDPGAIAEWSENNVEICGRRQQRILADVMPALKEGGVLIYSTCSYSEQEDEAIADWLMETHALSTIRYPLNTAWNIVETLSPRRNAYGYRFYPDKLRGEGFFIAGFRKEGREMGSGKKQVGSGERQVVVGGNSSKKLVVSEIEMLKPYLKDTEAFFFINQKEEVLAIPLQHKNDLSVLRSALYIRKAGVKLGTVIRNELIPDHELALSTILHPSVRRIETDKDTALQYLRREPIQLETDGPGWALLSYGQLPLGWIKILPNRINNYYPATWRILNK